MTLAQRFTPVRTGSRDGLRGMRTVLAVHPRAYGEQHRVCAGGEVVRGSPPCVRGAVDDHFPNLPGLRFTPVRTGSRGDAAPRTQRSPVHPRAYGEQVDVARDPHQHVGSPPCVRGAVSIHFKPLRAPRFTPVRTGSRINQIARALDMPVHPRAYGEQDKRAEHHQRLAGSPPCVRGAGT